MGKLAEPSLGHPPFAVLDHIVVADSSAALEFLGHLAGVARFAAAGFAQFALTWLAVPRDLWVPFVGPDFARGELPSHGPHLRPMRSAAQVPRSCEAASQALAARGKRWV